MRLIWPFVTRSHHEDVKALLEQRIADLTRELAESRGDLRKSLDHYAFLSHQRAIFAPPPEKPEVKPETSEAESQRTSDIEEAKRHGCRTRAQVADFITRLNAQRQVERMQNPDFAQAEAEGIEAAKRSVQ